jgi:hypothetical protein
MASDTLNKHVLQMLSHLNKYPIPDPQMVRDFNWFIKKYNLSVQSGEVTPPTIGGNGSGSPTIIETIIEVNGGALSRFPGSSPNGFAITPPTDKRLYGIMIIIQGTTSQSFSYNNGDLDVSITLGAEEIIGDITAGNVPTTPPFENPFYIFCDNTGSTPNDLSALTLTVKLYTA